jgi:acyl-CoA oxidase
MDKFISTKAAKMIQDTDAIFKAHEADFVEFAENEEFPWHVMDKMKAVGSCGFGIKDFGGPGLTSLEQGAQLYTMAKYDGSTCMSYLVINCLGMASIDLLSSPEQRQRFLPDMIKMNKFACFGLTEPGFGSDASSLLTTATKVEGGWKLNGKKRWIGHADTADYSVIYARNADEKNKVQAFVVEKGTPGYSTQKIKGKLATRITQNMNIDMKDVFVPEKNRLEKCKDFASGPNQVLMHSRLLIAWMAVGMAAGSYETALAYAKERVAFKKPIG